ncbi:MAG TPA: marine proteobacterial sortase target protein [Steroidobacter sp.]
MSASTPARCLGSLLSKPRAWPPRWLQSSSEASKLAERRRWEPKAWSKTRLASWALCLLGVCLLCDGAFASSASDEIGAGTLLFQDDSGTTIPAPRVHTAVRMEVSGIIARVEVRQRFENPSDRWVEGLYAFPLPERAAVDRLRMQIGERIIVGEIREKAQAQKLYEQARERGQRASVVHQKRPNLFRTAVANIGPGESIEITIGYLQIADHRDGRYSLRFPLTITARYVPGVANDNVPLTSETPLAPISTASSADDSATIGDVHPALAHADTSRQRVSFDIDLDAGVPLDYVKSTYHPIKTDISGSRAHVRLAHDQVAPDRDFELVWRPDVRGAPATAVFRERTDAGEHVLIMFMPPHEGVRVAAPREVILIIDTSGSMAGHSIEQARAALLEALDTLTPADRFNVIQFNSIHQSLFESPVQATSFSLSYAREYVARLRATGGTEMAPALKAALSMPASSEHLRQVIFITDGAVSNEDQLMRLIRERLGSARLFTVGIGTAPNGYFMRKAAQMGRGTFTFIGSTAEVDERMSALLDQLTQPVLTDIELHWPHGLSPDYAPASIGDLYAGEPIVVTARFDEKARGTLTLSGKASGAWTRQITLDSMESRPGIATLWARNRISDLMDLRASGMQETEIRAKVLPLALQYRLVSNYTSLVAVDRTPARPKGQRRVIPAQRLRRRFTH